MGEKGAELGVSLHVGRGLARRRPDTHRRWLVAVAGSSIGAIAVAVAAGAAPFPASITVAVMVPAAVIDIEQRRLPDSWVGGALIALTAGLALAAAIGQPAHADITIGGLLAGAIAFALPLLVVHLISPSAMGFGDVKAAIVLGAAIGTIDWRLSVVALCIAALLGAVVGVLGRHRSIPFGPFLVLGAWVVVLAGDPILGSVFAEVQIP